MFDGWLRRLAGFGVLVFLAGCDRTAERERQLGAPRTLTETASFTPLGRAVTAQVGALSVDALDEGVVRVRLAGAEGPALRLGALHDGSAR